MDVVPRCEVRHEGSAQRAAVSRADCAVVVLLDVRFDALDLVHNRHVALVIRLIETGIGNDRHQEILGKLVDYAAEIAPARTIAYEKEVDALHKMGLGLGGTLENVIVYNDSGWLNKLIYPDELVRHKILDVIGDMRLAGIVKCHIVAAASGHALNTRLAKKIFSENNS